MRSFGELLLALLLSVPLAAQTPAPGARAGAPAGAATWTPPPALEARVRADLASRWSVAPERVVVDWGRIAPPAGARAQDGRVAGVSSDGVVLLDVPAGQSLTRLAVRAGARVPRLVAARELSRGATLRREDIAEDSVTAWGDPARAGSLAQPAAGWRINRFVAAAEPLAPPTVTAPVAVRAGERVQAIYSAGALRLTFAAVAITDAAAGQDVSVRTDDGRRLPGVAAPDGSVRLGRTPGSQRMP